MDGIDFAKSDVLPQNNLATKVDNFVKQNTNFAQNINISKDVKTPIVLEFELQQNLVDTITLTVEKNVKAQVIFKYNSILITKYFNLVQMKMLKLSKLISTV